jgi:hypothetical protein
MSALLLLLTTAFLAGSAGLITASLRLQGPVAFLLGVYLIGYGELVVLVALLSPAHLVVRAALVPALGIMLAASVLGWRRAGRPSLPRGTLGRLREALRDPPLAFLGIAVALAFGYLTALALWTPPNSWDALWYHLPRAAFWKQEHGVGYIDHAPELRLNVSPPVAEIGVLYTMVVAAGDRFVATIALASYCATTLAVFGIGRRLGLDARRALFGALVFATLPVIVLQASGALNDLVLASFLGPCVYFLLGRRPAELGLAGLALALGLGTKLTAPLMVPFVIGAALLARPRWRPRRLLLVGAVSVALGSAWYFINLAETGALEGHLAGGHAGDHPSRIAERGLVEPLAVTMRLLLNFAEVPGAAGWWAAAYVVAAAALAASIVRELRGRREARGNASLAAVVAVTPLVVLVLGPIALRGYQWIFFHSGEPGLGLFDNQRGVTGASAAGSYYGPLGALLVASVAAAPLLVKRRALPRVALLFALAPVVFALVLAVTLGYDSLLGRYFMFPMVLAAACAGAFLRGRAAAWAVAVVAAVTVGLTLRANDEKPPSVWGEPRWWVQTRVGPGSGEARVVRFAEESVPPRAHIGLAIESRDWSYPFFGPHLERTVRFVPKQGAPGRDLDWLVVAPTRRGAGDEWASVLRTDDGWRVFVRR